MVVIRIRQAGGLNLSVKVRKLRVGQAEIPPQGERRGLLADSLCI